MAAYGYSTAVVNEYGLHELSEVSFALSAQDLRRVAAFLTTCADEIESGSWRSSHRHLTTFDRRWEIDHPNSDVIILHPSPEPPNVVA
jgi:hypothetical protein